MSYLSASENVGFSGIPQNISEASCATQYKMAVEGVSSGSCGEVNMFLHDNSGDEQAYIHLNDNFYSKFKIDPNELYTFHDSDVIAGEITVSHTEDNFIFSDNVDIKSKLLAESPSKELDLIGAFTNGDIKDDIKKEVVSNGHYPPVHTAAIPTANYKESKTTNTKVLKVKNQTQVKEPARSESFSEARRLSVHSPKAQSTATAPSLCTKNSINSASTTSNAKSSSKQSGGMETFLDVFKREQGLVENASVLVKTEPSAVPAKVPMSPPKKTSSGKTSQSKPRRGRGPAVHEALQRIPAARKAIPLPNNAWHAPGDALFQCGPLGERPLAFRQIESSSSDDDNMPDFEAGCVSACVEETAADSRGARLALRRAALRRHVARAHDALALASHHRNHRALASLLKKQLNRPGSSGSLPTQTVNHLLALRGMPSVLTAQERRKLRETGWSGGESGSREGTTECSAERCDRPALAGARYCLAHVTRAADQRLYAACAAVFAGGARCNQPLLPLQDLTPLCAEHAWKRVRKTSQSKPRRGRGPAVHEALQRIPAARKAIPLPNNAWHAPGDALFQCGPLGERPLAFRQIESSSSDDDNMPDFEAGCVSACVEETAADSRGARLALRRAALRRHVARAHDALALASHHRNHRALASLLKKQLNRPGSSGSLPTQTVNHLLALRGMPSVLTAQERRKLRETGWSGGESGSREGTTECSAERCDRPALAGARYCLAHVTRAADQRLYAACAAVFAGGARCNQPLLPLQDLTPLCAEHAWKRDNYDKLSRDCRPKKVIPENNSLSQKLNVCSNSSTYDSSEEAAMGALSETEYVTVASDSHEMEVEVGHVPPDDILDPAVLSQIPDEAFTEFFNQAEGGAAFAESSELAAALEAVLDERGLDERGLDERVLDERALDSIADCVFHSPHAHYAKNKMQVSTSMPMEITSRVPS
uniref:KANL2-like probable zinc-finger domain-containing protein n=1 Tax=Heliothis virescens TaxID=7102 RepID=A0A2A4JC40_HELVI